jgi:hypothetical protein
MPNAMTPRVRSSADLSADADTLRPMAPTPISPAPIPLRGSGAPPYMLPAYRRRRVIGG